MGRYSRNDSCSAEGAHRLKRRIEEYWRERGRAVDVRTVAAVVSADRPSHSDARTDARTDVRSDMLDGWPRGGP